MDSLKKAVISLQQHLICILGWPGLPCRRGWTQTHKDLSVFLCLPRTGIKGMSHHFQARFLLLFLLNLFWLMVEEDLIHHAEGIAVVASW